MTTIEDPTWDMVSYFRAWCPMCGDEDEFDTQARAERFVKEHTEGCYQAKMATDKAGTDA